MVKRIAVLWLSLAAIVLLGYAVGGAGGYLFGAGRPLVIAGGLSGGSACCVLALKIWRSYLDDCEKTNNGSAREQ